MTRFFSLPLALLSVALICLTAHAMSRRPAQQWAFFHFDGQSFVAGQPSYGTPFIAVRGGMRPVVLKRAGTIAEAKLAPGTGAVVGICYVQSSGGKLRPAGGHRPAAQLPVRILSGEKVVAMIETDEDGFFVATLPAGSYRIEARETREVTVDNGSTALISLRVGKRMVD